MSFALSFMPVALLERGLVLLIDLLFLLLLRILLLGLLILLTFCVSWGCCAYAENASSVDAAIAWSLG